MSPPPHLLFLSFYPEKNLVLVPLSLLFATNSPSLIIQLPLHSRCLLAELRPLAPSVSFQDAVHVHTFAPQYASTFPVPGKVSKSLWLPLSSIQNVVTPSEGPQLPMV